MNLSIPVPFASVKSRRSAFTLIELLVVIAIIALLAAILFPVFAQAREKARQVSCLSNEKQVALGFIQYMQDYDEATPIWTTATGEIRNDGWAGRIFPYVKSKQVFHCPNDGDVMNVSYMLNNAFAYYFALSTIPSWNAPASTVMLAEVSNEATVERDFTSPTETVSPRMYMDVAGPDANGPAGPFKGAAGTLGGRPFNSYWTTSKEGRHTKGSNFMLCDGHAKWLLPSQISSGYAPPHPKCNQDNTPPVDGCYSGTPFSAGTEGTFSNGTKPAATLSPL